MTRRRLRPRCARCSATEADARRWGGPGGRRWRRAIHGSASRRRWKRRMPGFGAEITPVVLTRDEEVNIGRTLGQLRWAREVIVVDSESTDRTREIAASFPNVRVTVRRFDDFAGQWKHALSMIDTDWILALD